MVYRYHDGTKHHFHAFRPIARLSRLGVAAAALPRVRRRAGLPALPGARRASRSGTHPVRATFDQACQLEVAAAPLTAAAVGDVLRHALGLSAWKRFKPSRWALRVNPSSGNLHPTEAYVICGALAGLADRPAVYHYAPDRHALELRCVFDDAACGARVSADDGRAARRADVDPLARVVEVRRAGVPLLPARSRPRHRGRVHRRRAVRMARDAAARWSHRAIAAVTGIDRDEDFVDAEREEPGCIMAVDRRATARVLAEHRGPARRRRRARPWSGRASQLSEDHVQWTFIDEVAGPHDRSRTPERARGVRAEAARRYAARPDRRIDARALVAAAPKRGRLRRPVDDRPCDIPAHARRVSCRARRAVDEPMVAAAHAPRALRPPRRRSRRVVRAAARLRRCSTGCEAACRPDFLWEAADEACRCGA